MTLTDSALKIFKRKDFQAILKKQYKKGKHLLTVRIGSKKEAVASEKDLIKNRHLNNVLGDIGYKKYYRYSGPSNHEDPDCLDWIIYLDPPN